MVILKTWKTKNTGHATQLTINAILEDDARRIISIGGDGTNHEVANGILQQNKIPSHEITHAHYPLGSGNDWVKTMNIPTDFDAWVQMVKEEQTILVNAGKIDYLIGDKPATRYFVNVAGMAYDAFIVKNLEEKKVAKKSGNIYLLFILRCLFKYKKQRAKVTINGVSHSDIFYTINIGVCKYSGGGMSLVPHANPTGKYLAVTLAGNISKLGVLLNTWRFFNETILKHKKIKGYTTNEVHVESLAEEPIGIEADGEFLGNSPVTITLLQKVLRVVIP